METPTPNAEAPLLVLGIGNRLMRDDAAGPLAIASLLEGEDSGRDDLRIIDGGTCGLSLLPEIEDCAALVVIDAARFGGVPGAVAVFEGDAMDAVLRGPKQTAHEVAVCDLLDAALCTTGRPPRRALVAIEPDVIAVGTEPTAAVAAAIPEACRATRTLIAAWTKGPAA